MVLKKKLAACALAAALALAMPALAWADEDADGSDAETAAETSEFAPGSSIEGAGVGVTLVSFGGGDVSTFSFSQALPSNVPDTVDAHFAFNLHGNITGIEVNLLASRFSGQYVSLYAQYDGGMTERYDYKVGADGTFSAFLLNGGLFAVTECADIPAPPDNQGNGQGSPTAYQPGHVFGGDGIEGTLTLGKFDGIITNVSAPDGVVASTVPEDAEQLCTFVVNGDATDVDLTFFVGTEHAGKTVTVFIEHNDGDIERQVATVSAEGNVAVHVDRLSVFTVVVGDYGSTSPDAGSSNGIKQLDPSAKSPKTNADLGNVLGFTVLMFGLAGAALFALRKNKAAE